MTRRGEVAAMVVGAAGALTCTALIVRFLLAYRDNMLGWKQGMTPPEFYDALGRHYGQGFLAGFFLCLCLMLLGAGLQSYRGPRSREPQQP
jgi:hypothetical protein